MAFFTQKSLWCTTVAVAGAGAADRTNRVQARLGLNAEDNIQQPLETTTLNGKVYTISLAGKVEPTLHS